MDLLTPGLLVHCVSLITCCQWHQIQLGKLGVDRSWPKSQPIGCTPGSVYLCESVWELAALSSVLSPISTVLPSAFTSVGTGRKLIIHLSKQKWWKSGLSTYIWMTVNSELFKWRVHMHVLKYVCVHACAGVHVCVYWAICPRTSDLALVFMCWVNRQMLLHSASDIPLIV